MKLTDVKLDSNRQDSVYLTYDQFYEACCSRDRAILDNIGASELVEVERLLTIAGYLCSRETWIAMLERIYEQYVGGHFPKCFSGCYEMQDSHSLQELGWLMDFYADAPAKSKKSIVIILCDRFGCM